jgi:hypothetical protein
MDRTLLARSACKGELRLTDKKKWRIYFEDKE